MLIESTTSSFRASSRRLFLTLDAGELPLVARAVSSAERLGMRSVARTCTRLGNGGLYPILTVALIVILDAPLRFAISSALSLMLAFAIYPMLKSVLSRTRPCDYDPSLVSDGPEPLDRYSCPSGHAMTAAAYGVPLLFIDLAAAPFVIFLCAIISWSRVALGHHDVSDVVLGALLGASIASAVGAIAY